MSTEAHRPKGPWKPADWNFGRFWLVSCEDRESIWCLATGREKAKTVYRNIGKKPKRGTPLQVGAGGRVDIADGTEFYLRLSGHNIKCVRQIDGFLHFLPMPETFYEFKLPNDGEEDPFWPRDEVAA